MSKSQSKKVRGFLEFQLCQPHLTDTATANEIIEKQLYYNAIGANCQSFATLLAKEISTHSTERLNNRVQRDGEEGLEPNPTVAKYIRFVPGPQQFLPPTVKLVVDHAAAVGVKVICNGCAKVERGFEDMLGIHF